MDPTARAIIDRYRLQPIPGEGGWFTQTWRSDTVLPRGALTAYDTDKPAGTAILALFCDEPEGYSALHRLPTTEVWNFCAGDPFMLLLLGEGAAAQVSLGPDITGRDRPQVIVPAHTWMGGRIAPGGRFSLLGCTLAPGFTEDDVEMGDRAELTATYPGYAAEIASLTRS